MHPSAAACRISGVEIRQLYGQRPRDLPGLSLHTPGLGPKLGHNRGCLIRSVTDAARIADEACGWADVVRKAAAAEEEEKRLSSMASAAAVEEKVAADANKKTQDVAQEQDLVLTGCRVTCNNNVNRVIVAEDATCIEAEETGISVPGNFSPLPSQETEETEIQTLLCPSARAAWPAITFSLQSADVCDRCGARLGDFLCFKGFGLRQMGHERRCLLRHESRRSSNGTLPLLDESSDPNELKAASVAPAAMAFSQTTLSGLDALIKHHDDKSGEETKDALSDISKDGLSDSSKDGSDLSMSEMSSDSLSVPGSPR